MSVEEVGGGFYKVGRWPSACSRDNLSWFQLLEQFGKGVILEWRQNEDKIIYGTLIRPICSLYMNWLTSSSVLSKWLCCCFVQTAPEWAVVMVAGRRAWVCFAEWILQHSSHTGHDGWLAAVLGLVCSQYNNLVQLGSPRERIDILYTASVDALLGSGVCRPSCNSFWDLLMKYLGSDLIILITHKWTILA